MGTARIKLADDGIYLDAIGGGVRIAHPAVQHLAGRGFTAEANNLRSLLQLDVEAIAESGHKTSQAPVIDMAPHWSGITGDRGPNSEAALEYVGAPVVRIGPLMAPVLSSPAPEDINAQRPEAVVDAVLREFGGSPHPEHGLDRCYLGR